MGRKTAPSRRAGAVGMRLKVVVDRVVDEVKKGLHAGERIDDLRHPVGAVTGPMLPL